LPYKFCSDKKLELVTDCFCARLYVCYWWKWHQEVEVLDHMQQTQPLCQVIVRMQLIVNTVRSITEVLTVTYFAVMLLDTCRMVNLAKNYLFSSFVWVIGVLIVEKYWFIVFLIFTSMLHLQWRYSMFEMTVRFSSTDKMSRPIYSLFLGHRQV